MSDFLTVKEAALRTGKSPSSIRRIIYPILESDTHPDRILIHPLPDEVPTLRAKGEGFAWRLSEQLLARISPAAAKETSNSVRQTSYSHDSNAELLGMLRRELEIKNQQIARDADVISQQMKLMETLGERLREGNVLIASLQQRLALPPGHTRSNTANAKPIRPEEARSSSRKPTKPVVRPKPKRRFFGFF